MTAQCGLVALLLLEPTLELTLAPSFRVALQNKELDSAIGVRCPRFGTGEKGIYLFIHVHHRSV